MIGTTIGSYRITERLGAGGMGEVYRARDTALDRDVAIKVLPDIFASDPERLARFEREAKTLASLNHPHIAQIHGLETAGAQRAIVMELVEGEDLASRLARGPLPIDEALPSARQIAAALEAAHTSGIVHRDLKPANIKVRSDGTVKVLDFGLAKLTASGADHVSAVVADSPTITSPVMTHGGIILGTAPYMSPEQAKGRAVDKRADIWAFGCVLFEMLSGRRLFAGDDVSETLAAVLRADLDWQQLPRHTPQPIRRLLRRCLVRDPGQRLPDIGVARLEIDDALKEEPATAAASRPATRFGPLVAGMTVAILASIAAGVIAWRARESSDAPVRVLQVLSGEGIDSPSLSPDGSAVVFVRETKLVVRSIETGDERELSGTEGASNPTWSPDSRSLAYFGTGDLGAELRAMPAAGGASRVVVRASLTDRTRGAPFPVFGAAWCAGGIMYVDRARNLRVVTEDGQDRVFAAAQPVEQEVGGLAYPHCLPDGRVLAVQRRKGFSALVVLAPTSRTVVLELPASNNVAVKWPVLVGSTHIVFDRTEPNAGLWALPVAETVTEKTGPERLLFAGGSHATVGAGTLIALSGVIDDDRRLVWVDRTGKRLGQFGQPQREFLSPALSPDGSQVASGGRRVDADAIWIHRQATVARWTPEDAYGWPAWSPDGRYIAYVPSARDHVMVRTAAGTDPRSIGDGRNITNLGWTPDGKAIVHSAAGAGVSITQVDGSTARAINQPGREPTVSPDGRLLAYTSLATGRAEVYVTSLAERGEAVRISTDGGAFPRWNSKGGELFFPCGPTVGADPQSARYLCVASIDAATGVPRGAPVRLFDATTVGVTLTSYGQRGYDVSSDGERILVQTSSKAGTPTITLIDSVETWLRRAGR